jgi:pyruvate dehydrogenase E1 component beta subunit
MGRTIPMLQAINEAMHIAMASDPRVILLGEDVAGGGGRKEQGIEEAWGGVMGATKGLLKRFGPERVLDTPISEMGFVSTAVGAAATGLRPIVELMFMDFLGVALDPMLNQAAKLRYMFGGKARVPLTMRTLVGAGLRAAAQHSQTLYNITTAIPGLKTVCPSNGYDARGSCSPRSATTIRSCSASRSRCSSPCPRSPRRTTWSRSARRTWSATARM